jgi:hypothetical protein
MVAPTLNYIETDFAHVLETADEFRRRSAAAAPPKVRRMRRLFALA